MDYENCTFEAVRFADSSVERRKEHRLEAEGLLAEVAFLNGDGSEIKTHVVLCSDLSIGGAGILSNEQYPASAPGRISFLYEGIEAKNIICYIQNKQAVGDHSYRYGLRFNTEEGAGTQPNHIKKYKRLLSKILEVELEKAGSDQVLLAS